MDRLKIRDEQDVQEVVRAALDAGQTLEIIGHGTRRSIGQPVATNAMLDLSPLNTVRDYEPSELIITAATGAPLTDVCALIDAKNQEFAFEPVNLAPLLGAGEGQGTLGGMIASGFAGPRRVRSGGVRDHLLGANVVSGFGETFRAGGKVVKNVTGYDICKLMAGSWGTLGVMTEVTMKVMPKAESETTLVIRGLDDLAANRAMTAALGSPYDVSGAAHLPASSLRDAGGLPGPLAADGAGLTFIRLEGIAVSVADRSRSLTAALAPFGAIEAVTDSTQSQRIWAALRDVEVFAASGPLGAWPVWRIVCPPACGGEIGQAIMRGSGGDVVYDWGGGLIWAALPPKPDAWAARLRDLLRPHGAHAMLVRASEAVRSGVDVFEPLEPGLAALSARIKTSFDPKHIFNRNRMVRPTSA